MISITATTSISEKPASRSASHIGGRFTHVEPFIGVMAGLVAAMTTQS
jgi:hypothetical protein